MSSQTELFFEHYAQVMDAHDAEGLAGFHMLPSVIVRDDNKRIYTDNNELIEARQHFLLSLKAINVVRSVPTVKQAMKLSDSIVFANVRWQFFDEQGTAQLSYFCSYTLQQVNENEMKIIVAVLDDEDKVVSNFLDSTSD